MPFAPALDKPAVLHLVFDQRTNLTVNHAVKLRNKINIIAIFSVLSEKEIHFLRPLHPIPGY